MLWCETGGTTPQDAEDLAVFLSQLAAAGVTAGIHVRSVPEGLARNAQFDLAPYLFDRAVGAGDRLVLVGADRITDQKLVQLRRLAVPPSTPCLAIGRFATPQTAIGVRARLSYVLGSDPVIVGAAAGVTLTDSEAGCPLFGVARATGREAVPLLLLVAPDLGDGAQARALIALALSRRFRVAVLTDGRSKHDWITANGTAVPVYHYGEVLPVALAGLVDVGAVFAALPSNYRVQSLLANLAVSGAVLVDGTRGHSLAMASDAFIAGPIDVAGLGAFLVSDILPNLEQIASHVKVSESTRALAPDALLQMLGESSPAPARPKPRVGIVFMPTNGIGLGHAQRLSLIAGDLDGRGAPVFAGFPSCLGLIKSRGFDAMPLIGRSPDHAQAHENDLANYLRLKALTSGAATLVFDGVHVFDSVYRSILENGLRGVWIRRGLWQAGQDNSAALDREKAFERVIVPTEAFAELNRSYSRGDHLREVGPVVQRIGLAADARATLRDRIAARFERRFELLVLSLLGAGVAADRSAQVQAICGMLERRTDCLHLVVAWPSTILHPGWFAWHNTRVVRTHHAAALAAAADLCVSAAGYNSFHEMLYNGVPAVFVPQTGAIMDDQRARAEAAVERGVAGMAAPGHLMALDREIGRMLDGGGAEELRRRLARLDLPPPGNADAARLIEEVTDGCPTLEYGPWPRDGQRRG